MSILKIARMGHPVLRAPARPLEPAEVTSARIQKLIDDMVETMQEYRGIGLAAPQVHECVRLFLAGIEHGDPEGDEEPELEFVPLINAEVTPVGRETVEDWEGCLSIPEMRGRVPRAREVKVRALDRRGKPIELRASDYPARVIQHEADHVDGVLFLDRMTSFETLTYLEEYAKYWTKNKK
jgi:peptide deformylase